MIPILSKNSAQSLDAICIKSGYISEQELMDNAGKSIAEFILEYISRPFDKKVLVVAGKGNNGGDGIISHYYLLKYGINSTLLLSDEKINTSWIFDEYAIPQNTLVDYSPNFDFKNYSIVIDGLFGIGLSRKITRKYKELVNKINETEFVLSIDIPSGINCDTGNVLGVSVSADVTLTMGYPKLGHVLNSGKPDSGELFVLDIGFNNELVDNSINLITDSYIYDNLQNIDFDAHKYSRGKLALLCGSEGLTGAAILASKSCLKIGTGITKLITPQKINSIFESKLPEIITTPINGEYGYLSNATDPLIENTLSWSDCLLLGPGLSLNPKSVNCVYEILMNYEGKLVLDAAGFQPIIDKNMTIQDLPKLSILTPHIGEFCKIFNVSKEALLNNPIKILKGLKSKLDGRILVLKGNSTILVSTKGEISIVSNGNSLLATAGTGDVLAGMIAGFASQGYSLNQSSILGTYLHAEISNYYVENISDQGLIASDIIELIPNILRKYS